MASDTPDAGQFFLREMMEAAERVDENRHGHVIAELAIMTILIDAKIVTIEEACERLELIQSVLPERYQSDQAKLRVRLLTEWLRGHVKPDASPDPQGWTPQVIEGGKNDD